MKKQDYNNHRRYYAPHHFVFYPAVLLLLAIAAHGVQWDEPGQHWLWIAVGALTILIGWLSFMMRQHYAIIPQNRIIRLEMRLRYLQIYGKRFEPIEAKLKFRQIAALRFASDEELPLLLERTLQENLSARSIKKLITDWQADHMRV